MNISRALYIPAILLALVGFWMLMDGQAVNAALAGSLGTGLAIISLAEAVRRASLREYIRSLAK